MRKTTSHIYYVNQLYMLQLCKARTVFSILVTVWLYTVIRNPRRDISFPILIFTRKEVETKRIGKEIKTIISRLNDLSSFTSNIEQNRN